MQEEYDALVVGAGMSGMALAFRLALFGKKVALLESHSIPGGLNSYYSRENYSLDVGLHALTNFVTRDAKKADQPLFKMLKQMRWRYDDLKLIPQVKSKIIYPDKTLTFTNHIEDLKNEIKNKFPEEYNNFERLLKFIEHFDELDLTLTHQSAKNVLQEFFSNTQLIDMLLCPLLVYGSAWERDMDLAQFVIMFKSIFLQGFMRPHGGVRTLINKLMEDLKKVGVHLFFKSKVDELYKDDNHWMIKKGEKIFKAKQVYSTIGAPETFKLIKEAKETHQRGPLSFVEALFVLDKRPKEFGEETTIAFFNKSSKFAYERPQTLVHSDFAVLCFSNNFAEDDLEFPLVRVTLLANFEKWKSLSRSDYKSEKKKIETLAFDLLCQFSPGFKAAQIKFSDVFTPLTVQKFTRREGGAIYGSTDKLRDGKTAYKNLYIAGTDQGFLGVIGSLLSGISMANKYGLINDTNTETRI